MRFPRGGVTVRYAVGAAAVAAGMLLRLPLAPWLGREVPYLTFFPAVLAAGIFGGIGPAILATVLSAALVGLVVIPPLPPLRASSAADYVGLGAFILVSAILIALQETVARSRRRAEVAEAGERNQRLLLQSTLSGIAEAVVSAGADGHIEFMNPVAQALTGWNGWEARGQPLDAVLRFADEKTGTPLLNPLAHVLLHGANPALADGVVLLARDGSRIPVEHSGSPIRDAAGRLIGAVMVFRDVTGRKRSEQALRQSERTLRGILESITDAFVALDSEWRFTYVNPKAEQITGRPRQELMGCNHWDVYPELRGTALEEIYRATVASQSARYLEYFSERSQIWIEINAYPAADGGLSIYFRDVTARKLAEQELLAAKRETEQARDFLQTTLTSIGDAVIATGAAGEVTFMNQVAAALVECTPEQAAGRPITEVFQIFHQDTGLQMDNPVTTVLRENRVVELANHAVLRTPSGLSIPIDDSAAPIRDLSGAVAGVVLVFRDIAERRQTVAALERSEERLRLALEAGQIGVWDWDIANNAIKWSDRVYEIHGVARGAFDGTVEAFSALIHPDDREGISSAIQRALQGVSPYEVEFRVVHPNGEVHWVITSATVFRDDAGKPVRMLGATVDMTDRHLAEVALRESEQRLVMALEAGKMATWDWDLRTNAVVWSEGHYNLLGLHPTTRPARYDDWRNAVHPADLEAAEAAIRTAIDTGSDYRAEYRVLHPGGLLHWLEARGQVHHDAEGRAIRMVGVLADITERKRVEESLLRANEELQHFAYAASHDLQEPLRTITSFSQLLVREFAGNDSAMAAQYVGYIVSGTTRMRSLIHGMLELSRAGGVETVALRPISSEEVLASTLATLKAAIDETGAKIISGQLPEVLGDPAQLAQVLQNLISNAIKYRRPEAAPEIVISAEPVAGQWRFEVRDNGVGFPKQHAEAIFAPFKRLHGSEIPGAGIGLALCRRIIVRHHGALWAEAREGEGSTFYFTLPAANQASSPQADD